MKGSTSTVLALVAILLSSLAIYRPVPGEGATVLLGWVIAAMGFAHAVAALLPEAAGARSRRALLGTLYLIIGLFLAGQEGIGLHGLTHTVALLLTAEGTLLLLSFLRLRRAPRAVWLVMDSLAAFALGFLLWFLWPSITLEVIGVLLGTKLLMSAFALLFLAGRRRSLRQEVPAPA